MTGTEGYNTWIEISEEAYAGNLEFFKRRLSPGTELSVVVKANAYGHGLTEISRLAGRNGADSFCVHSLDEALQLRGIGISKDILIMGPVPGSRLPEAVAHDLRLVVYTREHLLGLNRIGTELQKDIRVHLKLEVGTGRQGADDEDIPGLLGIIRESPHIKLESVYTHFANIEDTTDHGFAFSQLEKFNRITVVIKNQGFSEVTRHVACSAAVLLFPETHFEMVRLGISQYGLWPSRETFVSYKIKHTLNGEDVLVPVLAWKTRIAQIKNRKANEFIGYGCTYQTTRESKIAVLPVGYADGYDRRLSNQAHVLIRGRRAPVRGRVCMNFIMVDVTDIPGVTLGDEVILIGKSGREIVSADLLARQIGTINYEVVTRINGEIPRIRV